MRKRLSLAAIEALEDVISVQDGTLNKTIYAIIDKDKNHLRSITEVDGVFVDTDEPWHIQIPVTLEPVLTRPKRFIIVVGGRGSGKSQNIAAIEASRIRDYGIKLGCFREFQNSIEDSVYSLLERQAKAIDEDRFTFIQNTIRSRTGGSAKFKGIARNTDSVKSMDDFQDFWIEEAQATSANSLKTLTPTMRNAGGRQIFTANPSSSEDPFSKRFINPFLDKLVSDGIYEDDLHLVILMNWKDNPWFPQELESERIWDKEHLSSALYEHIWEGAFNDSVENSLIMAEWFDACIDAHKKLGFSPRGVKIAAHDPSDTGPDSKGLTIRHGSVITDIEEMTSGTINEGGDWATGIAIQKGVDAFTWDCDGMGVGLSRQVSQAFEGKNKQIAMFKGSESPDFPDAMYEPSSKSLMADQKTNDDVFKNKRAQYYSYLRDRCYLTYQAIVHNEYCDPDKLISFSSEIKLLQKLRSELCRMPVKPNANGYIELYTKEEMKSKFKFKSPNLADSVMMSLRFISTHTEPIRRPTPIRTMGRR